MIFVRKKISEILRNISRDISSLNNSKNLDNLSNVEEIKLNLHQ